MRHYKSIFESKNIREDVQPKIPFNSYKDLTDLMDNFDLWKTPVRELASYGRSNDCALFNLRLLERGDSLFFISGRDEFRIFKSAIKGGTFEELLSGDIKLMLTLKDTTVVVAIF